MTSASRSLPLEIAPSGSVLVQRSGTVLTLGGQPYTYNGLNWWDALSSSSQAANFAQMGSGANALRFWLFQTYLDAGGGIDWAAMDSLVAAAEAAGIKLLPTLCNQYGSSAPAGNPANDSGLDKDLAFFQSGYKTDVPSPWVMPYRQWVQACVTRYANSPTILCWILGNEIEDCGGTEAQAVAAFQSFVADVGAMVKGITANLLCLGSVAGYSGSGAQYCGMVNADYAASQDSPYLDILDYHDYNTTMPEQGGMVDAAKLAFGIGKAFAVNESGIKVPAQAATDTDRATYFGAKFSSWAASGYCGGLVWNWVDPNNEFEVSPGDPLLAVLGTAGLGG